MKNCEYCDYCKSIEMENMRRLVCLFTDTLLFEAQDSAEQEYPCREVSYQEYLNRRIIQVNPSALTEDSWRLLYKVRYKESEKNKAVALARAAV